MADTHMHHVMRTQTACAPADAAGCLHHDGCKNITVSATENTNVQTPAILSFSERGLSPTALCGMLTRWF